MGDASSLDYAAAAAADVAPDTPPPPPPTQEVALVDIEQLLRRSSETTRLEGEASATQWATIIHRFPSHLRAIVGSDDSYVVPSVVAIGPYHHHLPHLQAMEEVKKTAAYNYCRHLGLPVEEVYQKVLNVAGDARRCYLPSFAMSDADFALVMFVDGCFLLWLCRPEDDLLSTGCAMSSGNSFMKDLFLLENQIPWLVLDALADSEELKDMLIESAAQVASLLSPVGAEKKKRPSCIPNRVGAESSGDEEGGGHYTPPHLLGLLRFALIYGLPPQKRVSKRGDINDNSRLSSSMSISAVHLVQSGVKLTASVGTLNDTSTMGRFAEMSCRKKGFFLGELSLSPLFLNDITNCWLVNMVAMESATSANPVSLDVDGFVVSSYLSMLGMLVDREEDVHQLRSCGIITSTFSNAQTLAVFKCFGNQLRMGYNYFNTLREIDAYMSKRPVRIAIHKFIYNNYKTIAALLSIAGALIGVLKALYSLKKH